MNIDLSRQEAKLLDQHLVQHIDKVEKELAHTDKHELQHALALEVDALRKIRDRIAAQVAAQSS